MDNTPAILLRKTRFSDTSLLVEWLTLWHGRIKTIAKGARRPKSPFAGKLDLFFQTEISFARSRTSDLHTLREVVLCDAHEGVRKSYDAIALASYFVELIELVTESEHESRDLYDLLQRAITFLSALPASGRALLHFEAELVRLLGIHGQENVTPAIAIGRAYGRLPRPRAALLKRLPAA
jgi:DNA repair protein RecO (recombination protein O)